MECSIPYIPPRLHARNRKEIPKFRKGEILFRRFKHGHENDPFEGVRLWDISVNRRGPRIMPLCKERDVLFNTNVDNTIGEYLDESVLRLKIKEVDGITYRKTLECESSDGSGKMNTCLIELLHDKLPCNYAHSIFQITCNGEIVKEDNYITTLGKKNKSFSKMRNMCKHEIMRMSVKKEIRINWEKKDLQEIVANFFLNMYHNLKYRRK